MLDFISDRPLIYLVRHGSTDDDEAGKPSGFEDVPLNDKGTQDAEDAARYLGYAAMGRVISSDLMRAQQTAQEISPDYEVDPNLRCPDPDEDDENFDQQWGTTLNEYLAAAMYADKPLVLVTHDENIACAEDIVNGEEPEDDDNHCMVEPGGICGIFFNKKNGTTFRPLYRQMQTDTDES